MKWEIGGENFDSRKEIFSEWTKARRMIPLS